MNLQSQKYLSHTLAWHPLPSVILLVMWVISKGKIIANIRLHILIESSLTEKAQKSAEMCAWEKVWLEEFQSLRHFLGAFWPPK